MFSKLQTSHIQGENQRLKYAIIWFCCYVYELLFIDSDRHLFFFAVFGLGGNYVGAGGGGGPGDFLGVGEEFVVDGPINIRRCGEGDGHAGLVEEFVVVVRGEN